MHAMLFILRNVLLNIFKLMDYSAAFVLHLLLPSLSYLHSLHLLTYF